MELPITGSSNQLRQCIEAVVEQEHEYQNVVVTVRDSFKTEYVLALEDSDGEFLLSEVMYCDPSAHCEEGAQNVAEVVTRQQLEETQHLLELAATQEREQAQQIAELQ